MKKIIYGSIITFSLIMLNGCTKDNDNEDGTNTNTNIVGTKTIQLPYKSVNIVKEYTTNSFIPISEEEWNSNKINKILNTFTYGITATKEQIDIWSKMKPEIAIKEILNMQPFNNKLRNLENSMLNENSNNILTATEEFYKISESGIFQIQGRFSRGFTQTNLITQNTNFNPFIIKLGLWETNYHQVLTSQIDTLYILDNNKYFFHIIDGIRKNVPYQNILAKSATSTPILSMYNQFSNKYYANTDTLIANDDFAREFHQLFFGILGYDNLSYYENTTIESTSKILTGMQKKWTNFRNSTGGAGGYEYFPTPNNLHYSNDVEALEQNIVNPDFKTGIYNLANVDINNKESLETLPIMIINGLADNNIDNNIHKKETIINAWKSMQNKNILTFIQNYAISRCFHSSDRIRYMSSLDRYMKVYNLMNFEGKKTNALGTIQYELKKDNYVIDMPSKGVFGNWTGLDIKDNTDIFKNFYNNSINKRYSKTYVGGSNFINIIDKDIDKNNIKEVAEFLWNKLIGDNLKNFGHIERLQVYSLLYSGKDYNSTFNNNMDTTVVNIINNAYMNSNYFLMEKSSILNKNNINNFKEVLQDNEKLNNAIHFILGTPYNLYEEGI